MASHHLVSSIYSPFSVTDLSHCKFCFDLGLLVKGFILVTSWCLFCFGNRKLGCNRIHVPVSRCRQKGTDELTMCAIISATVNRYASPSITMQWSLQCGSFSNLSVNLSRKSRWYYYETRLERIILHLLPWKRNKMYFQRVNLHCSLLNVSLCLLGVWVRYCVMIFIALSNCCTKYLDGVWIRNNHRMGCGLSHLLKNWDKFIFSSISKWNFHVCDLVEYVCNKLMLLLWCMLRSRRIRPHVL